VGPSPGLPTLAGDTKTMHFRQVGHSCPLPGIPWRRLRFVDLLVHWADSVLGIVGSAVCDPRLRPVNLL
jgi:hypothetical protein